MSILDRYILKKFLLTFLTVVLLFSLVICLIDYTDKSDDFMEHHLGWGMVLRYYGVTIPFVINYITPIIVFITTIFVISRLAAHTEIVAMLSSGMSLLRVMRPVFLGVLMIGCVSFYLHGWVIPDGNKYRLWFDLTYIKSIFKYRTHNVHFRMSDQNFVSVGSYDEHKDIAYRVSLEQFDKGKLVLQLFAERMRWDSVRGVWQMEDWHQRHLLVQGERLSEGMEKDTLLRLSPNDFSLQHNHEALTMPELDDYIRLLRARGDTNEGIYVAEKYTRYAQPFMVCILTVLGILVSARKTRGGTGYLITVGCIMAFGFILLFRIAQVSAQIGAMHPAVAIAWPNLLFLGIAVAMYRYLPK